jgi:argininosuccinate lyase
VLEVLTVTGSIDSRDGRGGTATVRVREQLTEVLDRVDEVSAWLSAGVDRGSDGSGGLRD